MNERRLCDVFIRCAPETPLRLHLALAVIERWKMEDVNLRVIWRSGSIGTTFPEHDTCPIEVTLPAENFQWASRAYADTYAATDPYILSDDDHLPIGRDYARRMLEKWNEYATPEHVMMGVNSILPSENQNQNVRGEISEIYPAPCAMGTTMVHRKGKIDYLQFAGKASQQDDVVCSYMRKSGMKFSYFRDILYLHLGFGLSQVEPLLWLKY